MDVLWHFTSQTKQRRNGRLSEFFWKLGKFGARNGRRTNWKKNSLIAINRLHSLHQRRFIVVERQCGRWLSLRAEWSAPFRIGFPLIAFCVWRRGEKGKRNIWRIHFHFGGSFCVLKASNCRPGRLWMKLHCFCWFYLDRFDYSWTSCPAASTGTSELADICPWTRRTGSGCPADTNCPQTTPGTKKETKVKLWIFQL